MPQDNPLTQGLGSAQELQNNFLAEVMGVIGSGLKKYIDYPGQLLHGQIDPNKITEESARMPQAIKWVGETALGGLAGGPPIARGLGTPASLGVFAGPQGRGWDKAAALASHEARVSPDQAWQATGYGSNFADRRMRREISDKDAQVGVVPAVGTGESLTNVLHHPDVYRAYPELEATNVYRQPLEPGTSAMYDPASGHLFVDPSVKGKDLKTSLLHELQHKIDHMEGFSRGASPGEFSLPAAQGGFEAFKTLDTIAAKHGVNLRQADWTEMLRNLPDVKTLPKARPENITPQAWGIIQDMKANPRLLELAQTLRRQQNWEYARTAGEVSARLVEARSGMGDAALRANPPWGMMDVPLGQQVHRGSNY